MTMPPGMEGGTITFRDNFPLCTHKDFPGTTFRHWKLTVKGSYQKSIDRPTQFHTMMALKSADWASPDLRRWAATQDWGKEWTLKRNYYSDSVETIRFKNEDGGYYGFYGSAVPSNGRGHHLPGQTGAVLPSNTIWPELSAPDVFEWVGYGTKAIKATIPTNPASDTGTAVAELREGLPFLSNRIRDSATLAERIAGKYLEYEFAIKPLIGSVRETVKTAARQEQLLAQLERDSGKLVRRRLDFPIMETVSTEDRGNQYCGPVNVATVTPRGPSWTTTTTRKRWWFSGAYTYHFDRGSEKQNALQRALDKLNEFDQLYGTTPDAGLLWELTPWSWAADWVVNVGDVLSNISALSQDSLVIARAYIMCHSTRETQLCTRTPEGIVTQTFGTEYKIRRKATPYGFGLTPGAFSNRQWAILGALGITQGAPAFLK